MVEDGLDDARGGLAVAVRVDRLGHAAVLRLVCQELLRLFVDALAVRADELDRAGIDGLRALRRVAQHEDRLAKRRRLLLDSARIREDQVGPMHEVGKWLVVERVDEVDFRQSAELFVDDLADLRILVDREDDLDVVELLRQLLERLVDVAHRLAEVLAAMRRDEDDALILEVNVLERLLLEVEVIADRVVQCIDDRIARDEDGFRRDVLREQVGLRRARRRKVEVGDAARQAAVHLLRERRVLVVRTQAGLDVSDGRLVVVGSQCAGKRRRRVAVDEHDVRLLLRQDLVESHHGSRRDVEERLAGGHDVEIMIRLDMKEIEYLIEHLAMLCRDGHDRHDRIRMLLELEHDWCHLDCLRTRAEDRHDLDLLLFHCKTSLMLVCRILHMENPEFLGAEEHDGNDDADDRDGDLGADFRQGHGTETEERADDVHQQHGLALRETEIEQAVMKMSLIRLEDRHAAAVAAHDGERRVEDRQAERQDRHDQRDRRGALDGTDDRDAREHKAEELAARVAHEDLGRVEIVLQKAQGCPCHGDDDQGRQELVQVISQEEHRNGCDESDAGCQAVEAVDEVHRIGEADDPENRHGNRNELR